MVEGEVKKNKISNASNVETDCIKELRNDYAICAIKVDGFQ